MNKKIVLVCLLLVAMALLATGCRLPASGAPPTSTTQVSVQPTVTIGVAAEFTPTPLPPTPVVVTSTAPPPTALPPTALPPTAVPPTSAAPTQVSLPSNATRIQFPAGGTGTVVQGQASASQTVYYVLGAMATQTMDVKVQSPNADVYLGVFGANRQVFLDPGLKQTLWSGKLPATQDYYLSLTAGGAASSFSVSITIPPLAAGPTANVTPVAGPFNPVTAYGNPTFSDPMTGANVNDWVNPSTGVLPDTANIKIAETDSKFYVTGKQAGFSTWYFQWRELSDFYLQSTFDSGTCAGKDAYGLIIRGPSHGAGVSYGYVVTFSCDGQYQVYRLDSAKPFTAVILVNWTPSTFIASGANKQNVMGIKAVGDTLTIYANGNQIAQVKDSKYAAGRYGVYVSPDQTANYTYRVVQMSYWDLSK